jgi:hypothetical protein
MGLGQGQRRGEAGVSGQLQHLGSVGLVDLSAGYSRCFRLRRTFSQSRMRQVRSSPGARAGLPMVCPAPHGGTAGTSNSDSVPQLLGRELQRKA